MHILFVAPTPPVPTSGGRTRLHNLVKQLSTRHDVSVLSFVQPDEVDLLSTIATYCQSIETVPLAPFRQLGKWRNRLQGWGHILFSTRPRYVLTFPVADLRLPLRRLMIGHTFDIVVLQPLYVAELVDETRDTPVVLATENVESDIARKKLANSRYGLHRLRDSLEWRKLRKYERAMVRRFCVATAVSEPDVAMLSEMAPRTEVHLVPNGVDTESFLPREARRKPGEIVFFGTLNYGPNAEGIAWFCQDILPRVRSQVPDARLVIVGKDAPERVRALAELPGVELLGFVPDVRDVLWSATLSIVPLLSGGGTRLKVLEALAAQCPVVSTTLGAEGLGLCPGQHALIADSAEEFAQAVIRLLRERGLAERLAHNGQHSVAERYDWQAIAAHLEEACVRATQLHREG